MIANAVHAAASVQSLLIAVALVAAAVVCAAIAVVHWRSAPRAREARGHWSWQRTPTMFRLTALVSAAAAVIALVSALRLFLRF